MSAALVRLAPGRPVPVGLADLLQAVGQMLGSGRVDRAEPASPATSRPRVPVEAAADPLRRRPRPTPGGAARPPEDGGDRSARAQQVWTIVERVQGGDAEAFGELYDHYVDQVFRYLYYRLASRTLAEDLTSETFLRALRRIDTVTWQGRDLGAWLTTIARNLVADHYKSSRYKLEISTADMLDADRPDGHPESRPEQTVLDSLASETLLTAVRQLGPEQQECIVLRFLQGLSVAETAEVLSKNTGAVKALQYRAVRRLARLLPDGFAP